MRVIALVDGEHYPSVTRWGLQSAIDAGAEVVAALVVGGIAKLDADGRLDLGDISVVAGGVDPGAVLAGAIREHGPDAILDLSDEPVLGYDRRMELVAVSLANGAAYLGPDFRFDPPFTEPPLPAATLAVIGTGKRAAKTALGGHTARLAVSMGLRPIVVAMGRGGPPEPVVAGPEDVTLDALLRRVERGDHAASDYLEDALTSGVPTIGARRCGGGIGGRPFVSSVPEAAGRAVDMGADPLVLEGSGAAIPTVPWDAGILVAPAGIPAHHLTGYLGPLRLLLSDLLVFIIGAGPIAGADNLSALYPGVRRLRPDIRIAIAELQPVPLADVRGKDAYLATTAQPAVAGFLARSLERTAGCRVVGVSAHLADRAALERDLAAAPPFDVLLTELKAAAVDVAARRALDRGADVVFVDNRHRTARPAGSEAKLGDGDVDDLIREVIGLARRRAGMRM